MVRAKVPLIQCNLMSTLEEFLEALYIPKARSAVKSETCSIIVF